MMINSHEQLRNQSSSDADDGDEQNLPSRLERLNILNEGLQRFKLTAILNGKLGRKAFNFRELPVFRSSQYPNDQQMVDLTLSDDIHSRITDIASSWGFQINEIEGDGNCLFTAVATQIVHLLNDQDPLYSEHLRDLDFTNTMTHIEIARKLRCKVVEELQGDRVELYQSFLSSSVDIVVEAERFRESGTFSGPVGDIIPLAIANILQIPLSILNPLYLTPFVTITPEQMQPSNNYITLAFNPTGPGHYDVLTPTGNVTTTTASQEIQSLSAKEAIMAELNNKTQSCKHEIVRKPCRCGEKRKYARNKSGTRSYANRCRCIQKSGRCMSDCKCIGECKKDGCGGNNNLKLTCKTKRTPRKRAHNTKSSVTPKKGKISLEDNGEEVKEAKLNILEHCVLYAVIAYVKNKTGLLLELAKCKNKYNEMVDFINSVVLFACLPLFKHSLMVIQDEKRGIEKKMNMF